MPLVEEDQPIESDTKPANQHDPEYMLKGVQAFAVGVALFAASVAVANAALAQMQSNGPTWANVLLTAMLVLINFAISTFGCLGIILGVTMTGLWQVKGPIKIFDLGVTTSWIVLTFAIANGLRM